MIKIIPIKGDELWFVDEDDTFHEFIVVNVQICVSPKVNQNDASLKDDNQKLIRHFDIDNPNLFESKEKAEAGRKKNIIDRILFNMKYGSISLTDLQSEIKKLKDNNDGEDRS